MAFQSFDFLTQYDRENGVYLETPCSEVVLKIVKDALYSGSPSKLLDEYLSFLSITNGAQLQDAAIFSAEEFLESRKYAHKRETSIEIGYCGNLDTYFYHLNTQEYSIVNFYDHSEIYEVFDSLKTLVNHVIDIQGIKISS